MTTKETEQSRGAGMGEPLVRMRGIVKKFGDTVVLDGVDLVQAAVDRGADDVHVGVLVVDARDPLRRVLRMELERERFRFVGVFAAVAETLARRAAHPVEVRSCGDPAAGEVARLVTDLLDTIGPGRGYLGGRVAGQSGLDYCSTSDSLRRVSRLLP